MDNKLRKYAEEPYQLVVIHGGPGAPGEMKPVAEKLSKLGGVLEPFQTKKTVEGQVNELYQIIKQAGDPPVVLVGYSWGAWLSYLFTAKYPELVNKLILVSSGPFKQKHADQIMKTRLKRLNKDEQNEVHKFFKAFKKDAVKDKDFARFGELMSKADNFNQEKHNEDTQSDFQVEVYKSVWPQAAKLRKSGELLKAGGKIQCPVIAIHGDYDPHPYKGVEEPLSKVISNFEFILLNKCGHKPWHEKNAKHKFFSILKDKITG